MIGIARDANRKWLRICMMEIKIRHCRRGIVLDSGWVFDGLEKIKKLAQPDKSVVQKNGLMLFVLSQSGLSNAGTGDAFIHSPGCKRRSFDRHHTTCPFPQSVHGASTRSNLLNDNRP